MSFRFQKKPTFVFFVAYFFVLCLTTNAVPPKSRKSSKSDQIIALQKQIRELKLKIEELTKYSKNQALVEKKIKHLMPEHELPWPVTEGVFIASSSERIPAFPDKISGYRFESGKDFWGNQFKCRGTLRIFSKSKWEGIPDFNATMNGCNSGKWMIRWRSANPEVSVTCSSGSHNKGVISECKIGLFGYSYDNNCEQPLFKLGGNINGNKSSLVDIFYELEFWSAAP